MKKFKAPEGCGGVSLLGEWHGADKDGFVKIPHDNHGDLINHGFTPVDDSETEAELQKEAEAKAKADAKEDKAKEPKVDVKAAAAQLAADAEAEKAE